MPRKPDITELLANLGSSTPHTEKKNPSIQEGVEHLRHTLRTLANRATSACEEADEIRAFVLTRSNQLADAGVTKGMLKWRLRARITAAHKKTETALVALQATHFAIAKGENVSLSANPIGALLVQDQMIATFEHMAELAEAYLQATREELAVWQDIAR